MSEVDVFEAADRALQMLAALAGLEQENMNRSAGWRFLDMGRRTERAINTCRLARTFAADEATADDLDVLLDLIDSQITYRSRYMTGVALAPVRDMVLLDPFNPRSVGFQIEMINQHISTLPALQDDGLLEEPRQIIARLATEIPHRWLEISKRQLSWPSSKEFRILRMRFRRAISCNVRRFGRNWRERTCVIYKIRHLTRMNLMTCLLRPPNWYCMSRHEMK